jgi:hypothetical protein
MSAKKPQGSRTIGMNSITISANATLTFEQAYNKVMQYTNILAPVITIRNSP